MKYITKITKDPNGLALIYSDGSHERLLIHADVEISKHLKSLNDLGNGSLEAIYNNDTAETIEPYASTLSTSAQSAAQGILSEKGITKVSDASTFSGIGLHRNDSSYYITKHNAVYLTTAQLIPAEGVISIRIGRSSVIKLQLKTYIADIYSGANTLQYGQNYLKYYREGEAGELAEISRDEFEQRGGN